MTGKPVRQEAGAADGDLNFRIGMKVYPYVLGSNVTRRSHSSGGTTANSPALQRRDQGTPRPSPVGTTDLTPKRIANRIQFGAGAKRRETRLRTCAFDDVLPA